MVNDPENNLFLTGEPDEQTLAPVSKRRSLVDGICFGGWSFDDCLATLNC